MFRRLIVTVGFISVQFFAQGQTVFNSLEDIWKYADVHNITIRTARYELDKVHAGRKQSYAAFLPSVSASSSFTNNLNLQTTLVPAVIVRPNAAAGEVVPVQFGQKYIYQVGLSAQMDILNLQTWFNTRIANETENLNRASLDNVMKGVHQQLASQYYALMLMREAERLAERNREITDSVYLSVAHKFEEGTVNASNVDLARINKERTGQTLLTARYQVVTALNNLKGLLDMSLADSIVVAATMDNRGDVMQLENGQFFEDPAVRQAYYQQKVAMSRLKVSNSSFLPTISAAYSTTAQQNDNTFEPFKNNGPQWYPASFWSLRASWNIFTAGTRWLQSTQNKVNYYEAKMQYETAQKQSAIADNNLLLGYRKAQAVLEKAENIMKLSFDNYAHMSERYEAGIVSLDDRLNAFADYLNYQNQYLNSLSDALVQTYLLKIRQTNN